jgi:hypothetical protein
MVIIHETDGDDPQTERVVIDSKPKAATKMAQS